MIATLCCIATVASACYYLWHLRQQTHAAELPAMRVCVINYDESSDVLQRTEALPVLGRSAKQQVNRCVTQRRLRHGVSLTNLIVMTTKCLDKNAQPYHSE